MIFVSAGHCNLRGATYDPGAVGVEGRTEANETVRVRNRVIAILKETYSMEAKRDLDNESLKQYLTRIKPGTGSVVCEFHFNASLLHNGTGTETLHGDDGDQYDIRAAATMSAVGSLVMNIKNRGVIPEAKSHRGKLGLMREKGIVILVEVCFIDNETDMQKYDANFEALCQGYAKSLADFEGWLN